MLLWKVHFWRLYVIMKLWNFKNQASMDAERYFREIEDFCILIAFEWRLYNIVKLFKSCFCRWKAFLKIVYHCKILKNQASMDAERYFREIEDFCILIAFEWRLYSIVKFVKSCFCERYIFEDCMSLWNYEMLKIKLRWMLKDILEKLKIFAF